MDFQVVEFDTGLDRVGSNKGETAGVDDVTKY
jgi:hypothetical protein